LDDIAANIQSEMLHCFLLACYKIYKSRLTYYSKTPFILLSTVSIFLDAAADAAADIFFVIPRSVSVDSSANCSFETLERFRIFKL